MVQLFQKEIFAGSEIAEFQQFPYPLSPFQKVAIQAIVHGHHVLVTAPTGSGKTLPAEFAIRYFTNQQKKVIYTSPIKALSNQKFFEFQSKYPGISFGLITGDNKINPAAQVLIMTTEILMNSLFLLQGSSSSTSPTLEIDLQTELGCVIFDEIHYINDANRGHVWEKTLMMLSPMPHLQMVMLSATMHEPVQFAKWIENMSSHRQVVVSSTEHRVVPLGHYVFVTATESLFKKLKDKVTEQEYRKDILHQFLSIQDAQGKFHETAILKARRVQHSLQIQKIDIRRKFALNKLLEHLRDQEMLPALTFILSRKQVELCAQEITTNLLPFDSKIPYMAAQECERLLRSKLPNWKEYTVLPEYRLLVSLLEKGIGFHHSGMIPVFREMVEMFISNKSILLLIATESFSIGLDCPIKTVIFTGFMKYDGVRERLLEPHEYKQMAGRAGRRGIDKIGYVVHCANLFSIPSMMEYRHLLSGQPEPFRSKFVVDEGLVLKMISQKVHTLSGMAEFIQTSYFSKGIQEQIRQQQTDLETTRQRHETMVSGVLRTLPTPYNTCIDYLALRESLNMASHKKQKELLREIDKHQAEYPYVEENARIVSNVLQLEEQMENSTQEIKWMQQQILFELFKTCQFLKEWGSAMDKTATEATVETVETWHLTPLGEMAASFQEVPGLLMASLIQSTQWFAGLDARQLVACFAAMCWEQATTSDTTCLACDTKVNVVADDLVIQSCLQLLQDKYQHLYTLQTQLEMPVNYGHVPTMENLMELAGPMVEWCGLTDEASCRGLIQQRIVEERQISLGDFVKIILKIVAMKKELERVATMEGQIELLYKLSQIDDLLCKYIATPQSLYL